MTMSHGVALLWVCGVFMSALEEEWGKCYRQQLSRIARLLDPVTVVRSVCGTALCGPLPSIPKLMQQYQ